MDGASVIRFSPRVDRDFIPRDYKDLIQDSSPKPTLNTNSQNEGVVFAMFNYLESIAEISASEANTFNADDLRRKINDLFISKKIWGDQTDVGVDKIFDFYTSNGQRNQGSIFYLSSYTKAIHDCYFGLPAKMEMLEKIRCGWPVFNAIFDRLHDAVHPPAVMLKGWVQIGRKVIVSVH